MEKAVSAVSRDGACPPSLPENWYILATSNELAPGGIISREIGGHEMVLYRSEKSGVVHAFAGHCAHMGCHLKHGTVIGDDLRCCLHFRHIQPDGRFLNSDGSPSQDLVQPGYAVKERYNAIFVYMGGEPRYGLPESDLIAPDKLIAQPAGELFIPARWFALMANGFDMEHLHAVHHRELMEEPVISEPYAHAFRIAYHTRAVGKTLADRVLKKLSGNSIRASMTCIGGTTVLVQSQATMWRSLFLMSLCPARENGTLVRAIVGVEKKGRLFNGIGLRMAHWLFKAFLIKDLTIFDGIEWHPPEHLHTSGDNFTTRFYEFITSLKPAFPQDQEKRQRP